MSVVLKYYKYKHTIIVGLKINMLNKTFLQCMSGT